MCFGFSGSATTRRDKHYYRGEENFPSRPVSSYERDRYGYRRDRNRDRDWDSDHYSISNNPSRSSYQSYHRHHHHSDHRHHHHGHHQHRDHDHHNRHEYRRENREGERERYYYQLSARSSLTTTNGNGYGEYGAYGNACIPVTASGAGRLLGGSGAPIATPGRRRSSVSELLTVTEGQRQLELQEQGPVVYERTTDAKARYV